MASKRPWMPLYVADYRADTAHLSAAQHGAYLLLIMHYWQMGGLPGDDPSLARIAAMSASEWKKARPVIAAYFTEDWRHNRIDEELARAEEISTKRRASAKQKHSKSSANAEQLHTHARASSHPQSQESSPPTRARPLISDEAKALAAACREAAQAPTDDPNSEFYGLDYQAEVWITRGYDPARVVATFVRLTRERPLKPMVYLIKAIEGECARAPPAAKNQPAAATVHSIREDPRATKSVQQVARELLAEQRSLNLVQVIDGGPPARTGTGD